MALPVFTTFTALAALAAMWLTGRVGLRRGAVGILRGHGGDAVLEKRIRIHGNLMENAPIFALALLAAEVAGIAAPWLWAGAASFILGRVYHFVRFDEKDRAIGMILTQAPALLMAVAALWTMI